MSGQKYPIVHYDADGVGVEVILSTESHYGEDLGRGVTVFRERDKDSVVGFRLDVHPLRGEVVRLRQEIATLRAERDAAVAEAVAQERERARAMNRWMRGLDKAVEDDIRRGE